jgi:hypothetical protein
MPLFTTRDCGLAFLCLTVDANGEVRGERLRPVREKRLPSIGGCTNYPSSNCGGIAQLVERLVRNEKARGSNPLTSKYFSKSNLRK